ELHYNRIANPLLWFVHHGMADQLLERPDAPHTVRAWEEGYVKVNERLSAAAAALPPNPLILVQDYHLFLAPRLLRRSRPDALVAHFLHVPWPEAESWDKLPGYIASAILDGMLGADLLGFQTPADAGRFLDTCSRCGQGGNVLGSSFVGMDGHTTLVRTYPITVDVSQVIQTALEGERQELWRRISWPERMQTVARVDRLDPAKNLTVGFLAFERLLEREPALRGHVRFVAHLVPSRTDVPEYRYERERVLAIADAINSRFGDAGWKPIELFLENNRAFAYTLLRRADVLLFNSLADGMNLVAKEAVLLNPKVAIVLSRKAGAWNELGPWALGIDPANVEQTAEVLRQALAMSPQQRRQRVSEMSTMVARRDLTGWFDQQLEDLVACGGELTSGRPAAHDHVLAAAANLA
ncbi:MAG: trehalose-6-phosphate synthase, partial [Chloroflexota bacterium]|nr:trehalose-6-phosphate synthase [Chloroflexota bacterium]